MRVLRTSSIAYYAVYTRFTESENDIRISISCSRLRSAGSRCLGARELLLHMRIRRIIHVVAKMFDHATTCSVYVHASRYDVHATRGRMVATAAQSSSALVFEAKMTELSEEDTRKLQDGMTVLNSILSELFAFHSRFVCVALFCNHVYNTSYAHVQQKFARA